MSLWGIQFHPEQSFHYEMNAFWNRLQGGHLLLVALGKLQS